MQLFSPSFHHCSPGSIPGPVLETKIAHKQCSKAKKHPPPQNRTNERNRDIGTRCTFAPVVLISMPTQWKKIRTRKCVCFFLTCVH